MNRLIAEVAAALHPTDTVPTQAAWNHANLQTWIGARQRKPAAVLLAIRDADEPQVVFTLRRKDLPDHPGEVSLPGGRAEAKDSGPIATALRESAEEIHLRADDTTPLGYLDRLDTISNYCVTPVVARLAPGAQLRPAPAEVAKVFEVPLKFLLDSSRLRLLTMHFEGRGHRLLAYRDIEPRIWGVTADIFANLLVRMGRLDASCALSSHTPPPEERSPVQIPT